MRLPTMRRKLVLTAVTAALLIAGTACARGRPTTAWQPGTAAPPASALAVPSATTPAPTSAPVPPSPTAPRPTTTPTPPGIPAALVGKDIEVIPTTRAVVALTFDAGANADGVPTILATLAARRITATFFLTGDFAVRFPGSVRTIASAGHRIGNHTATHPHSLTKSDAELRTELTVAATQLRAAGAADPRPLFRFPFGERDARTIAVVNTAGYVAVRWTVDSLGWQGRGGRGLAAATQAVVDRVVAAARAGEIVLMHVGSHPEDGSTLDAAALPTVIDRLRAKGYGFVTLDALLP